MCVCVCLRAQECELNKCLCHSSFIHCRENGREYELRKWKKSGILDIKRIIVIFVAVASERIWINSAKKWVLEVKLEINTILLFSHLTFYKFFEHFRIFHSGCFCLSLSVCVCLRFSHFVRFVVFVSIIPWRQVAPSFPKSIDISCCCYSTFAHQFIHHLCVIWVREYTFVCIRYLKYRVKAWIQIEYNRNVIVWRITAIFYWSLCKCLHEDEKKNQSKRSSYAFCLSFCLLCLTGCVYVCVRLQVSTVLET